MVAVGITGAPEAVVEQLSQRTKLGENASRRRGAGRSAPSLRLFARSRRARWALRLRCLDGARAELLHRHHLRDHRRGRAGRVALQRRALRRADRPVHRARPALRRHLVWPRPHVHGDGSAWPRRRSSCHRNAGARHAARTGERRRLVRRRTGAARGGRAHRDLRRRVEGAQSADQFRRQEGHPAAHRGGRRRADRWERDFARPARPPAGDAAAEPARHPRPRGTRAGRPGGQGTSISEILERGSSASPAPASRARSSSLRPGA